MAPRITWSAHSVSGTKKPENDDAWLIFAAGAEKGRRLEASGSHSLEDDDLVLAVSDGMGGGNAGNLASRLLLTQLARIIPKTIAQAAQGFHPDYLDHLEQSIYEIHKSINHHGDLDPLLKGMAATLTLAWLTPENIYIGHVGDSRLYLHRENQTRQITADHTYAWKKFNKGEINEFHYRTHPRRCILYEVVGGGHTNLKPSILSLPYQKGDRFMLCSDGIVDGLNQRKIHQKLSQNQDSTNQVTTSLMNSAVEVSGLDDTTCVVFDVQ